MFQYENYKVILILKIMFNNNKINNNINIIVINIYIVNAQ